MFFCASGNTCRDGLRGIKAGEEISQGRLIQARPFSVRLKRGKISAIARDLELQDIFLINLRHNLGVRL